MVTQGLPRSISRRLIVRLPKEVSAMGMPIALTSCCGLFLTLPWGPHWPFGHFGLAAPPTGLLDANFGLADLFLTALVIGWSLALLGGRDRLRIRPLRISIPLLLFTLSAFLAVFHAFDRGQALQFAVRTLSLAGVYFFLSGSFAAGRLTVRTVAYWLAPGVALNGFVAVLQTINQNPIGLTWLAEPRMLRTTPGTAVILVHGARVLRAFGMMPHANVLGGLLSGALPLVAAPLFRAGLETGRVNHPGIGRHGRGSAWSADSSRIAWLPAGAALAACVALMAVGVVLSFSRSSWAGLLVGMLYLAWWGVGGRRVIPRRAMLIGAGILIITASLLALERDEVLVRLRPESNRLEQLSIQERLALQALTLKVIAWRPLTGVGGNNNAIAEARFLRLPGNARTHLYPVHNTYLLAEAELGPLGAGTWIVLMLVPLAGLWRRQGRRIGAGEAFAGCSLVVVAVAGVFDYFIWTNGPVAVIWVTALAIVSGARTNRCRMAGSNRPSVLFNVLP